MVLKYFLEIKNRTTLIIISWLFTFFICYIYKDAILFTFIKPSLYLFKINTLYFISTNLTEIFSTHIKLACFISNQIIILYGIYHIFIFIVPGLYKFEYFNFKFILICSIIFWILTTILIYKLILPWSWKFFLSFQQTLSNNKLQLHFEAKLWEYLSFFIKLYNISIINCQFIILIFIYINFIKKKLNFIKNFRKFIYFVIFFISALITPPDILNQILLSLITITIYEIILFSLILKNKIKKFY